MLLMKHITTDKDIERFLDCSMSSQNHCNLQQRQTHRTVQKPFYVFVGNYSLCQKIKTRILIKMIQHMVNFKLRSKLEF